MVNVFLILVNDLGPTPADLPAALWAIVGTLVVAVVGLFWELMNTKNKLVDVKADVLKEYKDLKKEYDEDLEKRDTLIRSDAKERDLLLRDLGKMIDKVVEQIPTLKDSMRVEFREMLTNLNVKLDRLLEYYQKK